MGVLLVKRQSSGGRYTFCFQAGGLSCLIYLKLENSIHRRLIQQMSKIGKFLSEIDCFSELYHSLSECSRGSDLKSA